jgi:hypothetical protein
MTAASTSRRGGFDRQRRLDPDSRLGLELTLWGAAAFVVLVPFGVLLVLVRSHSTGLQHADQSVAADAHTLAVHHHGLVTFLQAVSNAAAPRSGYSSVCWRSF